MKTKTLFRTFKNTGETIALFPEIPADHFGDFCQSYMLTGQHGAASVNPEGTRTATPEETATLRQELESIGYEIEIVNRVSPAMHRARRRAATKPQTAN